MLIIAQVLKEKWLKITVFAHSQTTNKLVNKAANDSARVSGQDRKKTARSPNQSDCRIWRIPPARNLENNNIAVFHVSSPNDAYRQPGIN